MATYSEEQVLKLAELVGIAIAEEELAEVTNRFDSLMRELDRLTALDLTDVQPVSIFPEDNDPEP